MSLLFYKRPDYVARAVGPVDPAEYERQLEKTRKSIPSQLSFEMVVSNRAMPPVSILLKIRLRENRSWLRSALCTTLWGTSSTSLTMPRIFSSISGLTTTPTASSQLQSTTKRSRHRGVSAISLNRQLPSLMPALGSLIRPRRTTRSILIVKVYHCRPWRIARSLYFPVQWETRRLLQ